jgi:hypothetical protein
MEGDCELGCCKGHQPLERSLDPRFHGGDDGEKEAVNPRAGDLAIPREQKARAAGARGTQAGWQMGGTREKRYGLGY